MIEAEISIRKYIKVLNDSLHGRTFMNYEQFCEALSMDLTGARCYRLNNGLVLPAIQVIIMNASRKGLVNYYPEYIKALFNEL